MFRSWLEEKEEISQPYYRIVAIPLYGASNQESERLAPGTYWTPRWDAILLMAQHIFKVYSKDKDIPGWFDTTIYQLDKAVMDDAPKEHKWAFSYGVDAGEKVLVKALEKPKVVFKGHPKEHKFLELIIPAIGQRPPFDYSYKGTNKLIPWKGKEVYLAPNYEEGCIDVVVQKGWQYQVIKTIHSLDEWKQFTKEADIPDSFYDPGEAGDSLDWFMYDMKWH
jgi:hypothetical protein